MLVDGGNPSIEEIALGTMLLAVFAFYFQHQHIARGQPDEEVGATFSNHPAIYVEHLEAKMIVLS